MIYLDEPNINLLDMVAVQKALDSKNISTVGEQVGEFEKSVAAYLGGDVHCIAVNSGSAALFVSLKVLGVGPGDEVIIPATTFVATAHAITMTGAKPVVVDIDPNTWNIDPAEIEKAITIKTKAIIPVHLYGNPCDMDAICNIANQNSLYIIEDACQSLGAKYKEVHTAKIGAMLTGNPENIGCFSFNRNKIITAGGGGMLVTYSADIADKARQFINQGRDKDGNVAGHGFNFGMTNQNAALGLSQIGRLPEFLEKKKEYHNIYSRIYANKTIFDNGYKSSHWFNAVAIDRRRSSKSILQIQKELKEKGIPTRRVFEPINAIKPYESAILKTPNAVDMYLNGLCLPSSTLNTMDDIEYVAKTLLEVLAC